MKNIESSSSNSDIEKNNRWDTLGQENTEDIGTIKKLWEENRNEIKGIIDPILEKIKEDDYIYILNAYGLKETIGDESLIGIFSGVLGIETPPILVEKNNPIENIGGFKALSLDKDRSGVRKLGHSEIIINREGLRQNLNEEKISPDKIPIYELATIAHEMWHAYQFNTAAKGGNRSSVYKEGIINYKDCTNNKNSLEWCNQIVELEAEYFGHMVSKELEKANKVLESMES